MLQGTQTAQPKQKARTAATLVRPLVLGRAPCPVQDHRRQRRGLKRATDGAQGLMRVRTIGRRTGADRPVILAYLEDGPNLVTMAMNGWADPEPAWWLNLQAHPDVTVELAGATGRYHAHAADKDERPRLWARWGHYDKGLDAYAARRSRETQVVILEPLA